MAIDAPPGEDGFEKGTPQGGAALKSEMKPEHYLKLVQQAVTQSTNYQGQINRNSWQQAYRAFHNEHAHGSKYGSKEYLSRSKLFRPKTRQAVFKHMAAVRSTLFGTVDAIQTSPGNESDPAQRAAAAIMKELVNYRTDRSSGRNALPWFMVAMGAAQDASLTGICASKQHWQLDLRKQGRETVLELDEATGLEEPVERDVWVPLIDRPNIVLFPPEQVIIDTAADWTNPGQSAAYVILKYPMAIDAVHEKQKDPRKPWKEVGDDILRSTTASKDSDAKAVRHAREGNLDRYDETQTGDAFQIVWVYETFMRVNGEDVCFFSVEDRALLTDPEPVREVYPEQFGDRPIQIGYGSLESHRIFPMSPVESWQQNQIEINDITNLTLDAIKQNVMPIPKVVRGRQVDLAQLQRRAAGSAILVTSPDDVTWDKAPDVQSSVALMMNRLDLDFDEAAHQMSGQSVQANNSLDRTLGGLNMIAGAANSVQEFDIHLWVETWVEPVLSQLVNLEAYYEQDETILGLCGERAKLATKYGINEITDDLLEQQIIVRVNLGLAAGDPMMRLQKFQAAASIALPMLEKSPEFASGEKQIDYEAVMDEVFGGVGYRDGGRRFVKEGSPKGPNPAQDATVEEIRSKIRLNDASAQAKMLTSIAALKKTASDEQRLMLDAISDYLQFQRADQQQNYDQQMGMVDRMQNAGQADADRQMATQQVQQRQGVPMLPPPGPPQGGPPPGMSPAMFGLPPPAPPPPPMMDMGMDEGMPGEQPALGRQEIIALLQQINAPREKRVTIRERDPSGRIAALQVEHLDGSPPQVAIVSRGQDGQIAGLDVRNIA